MWVWCLCVALHWTEGSSQRSFAVWTTWKWQDNAGMSIDQLPSLHFFLTQLDCMPELMHV